MENIGKKSLTYTPDDFAIELEAQLPHLDLDVDYVHFFDAEGAHEQPKGVIVRLHNGQEFLLQVTRWGGPRA